MAEHLQFIDFVQRFVSAVAVAPMREAVRKRESPEEREGDDDGPVSLAS
ncbi:MAG: hypothetical protein AAF721_09555 [Myxococcota bacterium]